MAVEYELTQQEVHHAQEFGNALLLSLMVKFVLDAQEDRNAAATEIENAIGQLIHQFGLHDTPEERHEEFRRAAEDHALKIVKFGKQMKRLEGKSYLQ